MSLLLMEIRLDTRHLLFKLKISFWEYFKSIFSLLFVVMSMKNCLRNKIWAELSYTNDIEMDRKWMLSWCCWMFKSAMNRVFSNEQDPRRSRISTIKVRSIKLGIVEMEIKLKKFRKSAARRFCNLLCCARNVPTRPLMSVMFEFWIFTSDRKLQLKDWENFQWKRSKQLTQSDLLTTHINTYTSTFNALLQINNNVMMMAMIWCRHQQRELWTKLFLALKK